MLWLAAGAWHPAASGTGGTDPERTWPPTSAPAGVQPVSKSSPTSVSSPRLELRSARPPRALEPRSARRGGAALARLAVAGACWLAALAAPAGAPASAKAQASVPTTAVPASAPATTHAPIGAAIIATTAAASVPAAAQAPVSASIAAPAPAGSAAAPGESPWRALADPVFRNLPLPAAMQGTAIAQGADGFLWLGTQTGLVRWDGYRFRTWSADPNTPGALTDSYVLALHMDTRGRLWIGTSAGGLARMDTATERFVTLTRGPQGLSHVGVSAIEDDGHDGLWVGTGAGLDHLAPDGATVRRHEDGPLQDGLPTISVEHLLLARDGSLWVGTASGVYVRPAGKQRFRAVPLGTTAGDAPTIASFMEDRHGRVWIGTRSHGVFVVPPGALAAEPLVDTEHAGAAGLQGDSVFALVEIDDGEVWVGTDGGGIVRVDTRTWTTRRFRHHDRASAGLPDDDDTVLFRDRSGLVWLVTNIGLSITNPTDRAVSTWLGYEGRPDGVSHANVQALLAQPDGSAWLGLGDGGVDIVDPRRGRIGQLLPDATRPLAALPKGRVLSMARAPDGTVFLGTQQGLYRADAAGRRVERIEIPHRKPAEPVWALHAEGARLWIGGLGGLLAVHVPDHGPVQVLDATDASLFGDARVTSITEAGGGRLWVGTRAGLVRYDTVDHRVERLPQDAPGKVGLPGGYVTTVFTDRRNRLWVASFGTGIRVVESWQAGADPVVRRIGVREGLPNEGVDGMLMDDTGDVWASTDDGLARISGSTLAVTTLHAADGVGISTYWTNAAGKAPTGELLFGGNGGLTVVDPTRVAPWTYRAPMVVTELDIGAGRAPVERTQRLELDARRRHLQVEFAALDYSAPEALHYAYRLLGFDHDWIATDPTRRLASYTNLPPGDYTLELRGSNRQGLWSLPLQWPVRVLPAWYETNWFRGALSVLLLLAVIGVVQGRTLVLQRRQLVLQELVAQRTAELELRSAELRESQRRLEQMAYYDGLTGLPNRRLFGDDLKRLRALAQRGEPFTLLLIDLDRFKEINDSHGHDAGDALLLASAQRLAAAVREIDRVARLGGDEFAVLLARSGDRAAVDAVCARIADSLRQPVIHRGGSLRTTASIGVAACHGECDADELYKAADVALYEAKRGGRDGWRWAGHTPTPAP